MSDVIEAGVQQPQRHSPSVSSEWFLVPNGSAQKDQQKTQPATKSKKQEKTLPAVKSDNVSQEQTQASAKHSVFPCPIKVISNWKLLPTMCIVGTSADGQQITTSPVVQVDHSSKSTVGLSKTCTLAVTTSGTHYLVCQIDPAFAFCLGQHYPNIQWSEETCLLTCLKLHQQELQRRAQSQQMQTHPSVSSVGSLQPLGFCFGGAVQQAVPTEPPSSWFEDAMLQPRQQSQSVQDIKSPTLNLRLAAEYSAVPAAAQGMVNAVATISCEGVGSGLSRLGSDIVCVIDVSGSMAGPKVEQARRSLEFVAAELGPLDRLSVVKFNDRSQVVLPLTVMDAAGQGLARQVARSLRAGGGTSVGSGLILAGDVLSRRRARNDMAAVLLMSDGCSNDCTEEQQAVIANPAVRIPNDARLFTFGYGSDHDANLLAGLARRGAGAFFFVRDVQDFPGQLADCLSSIVGVAFTRVMLRIAPANGAIALARLHAPRTMRDEAGLDWGEIGALPADAERDIVFQLQLSPQAVGQSSVAVEVCAGGVRTNGLLEIERPLAPNGNAVPGPQAQHVMVHVARVTVAEALQQAQREAARGKLASARSKLEVLLSQLEASPVSSDTTVMALMQDLRSCIRGFVSEAKFREEGEKMCLSSGMNHMQQQSSSATACYRSANSHAMQARSAGYRAHPNSAPPVC
eukprot:gnl/MRDRNA2_/MRDRNA2_88572_c0_seq1.p1 gnl/MRDRNA2_/MRDRNA2_88572_c0~~gnl/MRDRNA2_/MRDRNA2_88572_c0_seq1.p1  ORF type:complete len:727 (+),score=145.70 gnl/MRDRNA2_/MRDRNA2_88572_c0_seq1:127-2181(+)